MSEHADAFYVTAQVHLKRKVFPGEAGAKVNADFKKALESKVQSQAK